MPPYGHKAVSYTHLDVYKRQDQILNAKSFEKQGFSYVIEEEKLTADTLQSAVDTVFSQKEDYIAAMKKSTQIDSIDKIMDLIEKELAH